MFNDLNPLLHSQLRLAIMSLLVANEKADFTEIKEETGASSGNVSVQIKKLEEAGYLSVKKSFKNNYPNTEAIITKKGIQAFENYVNNLKKYIQPNS